MSAVTNSIAAVSLDDELAEVGKLPEYVTLRRTWRFLGISKSTLYRMIDRNEVETRRWSDGAVRIPRASIHALVLQRARESKDGS